MGSFILQCQYMCIVKYCIFWMFCREKITDENIYFWLTDAKKIIFVQYQSSSLICNSAHSGPTQAEILKG